MMEKNTVRVLYSAIPSLGLKMIRLKLGLKLIHTVNLSSYRLSVHCY